MITWRASISHPRCRSAPSAAGSPSPLLEQSQRLLGDHQRRVADHVGDADLARRHHVDVRACCGSSSAPPTSSASRTTSVGRSRAPLVERLGGLLGRGLVEARGVEDGDAVALGVHRERRAQRATARLAVDLDVVVARLGAEGDAAAAAVGHAQRARRGRGRCPSGARPWRWSSRPRRGRGSRRCRGGARPGRRAPSRARATRGSARRTRLPAGRPWSACRAPAPWWRRR